MKLQLRIMPLILAPLLLLPSLSMNAAAPTSPRLVFAADSDWKFTLGDPTGAEALSFSDSAWRRVDLPHDWSIEGRPDANNPTGAGGGFFPTGVGWYRKSFKAPPAWRGKRVSVEFDGVYKNATVYLNGNKLGTHPYGYTSFAYDLTPGLNIGSTNELAVRVDNSEQPNSRWYSGSGIYRHVRVLVTEPTHVAQWGVFVTTPKVSDNSATISIRTSVANDSDKPNRVTLETSLYDRAGKKVGRTESVVDIAPGKDTDATQTVIVANPAMWSPATPTLYRAVSRIRKGGQSVDQVETPFGIRTLSWSAEKGLLLNGNAVKLAGGSVHHDNGPLGAAAFDRAEERKVELLKAAGYNAVRTAHNPPSPAFLDACDRIGLLVLDEPFDTWKANKVKFDYGRDFDEWWKRDISSMVLRDRNHPSIVVWGIGNEIPELEVEQGPVIAKQLADQVRSLDSSRPLTLAFPGTTTSPNAAAVFALLDITGYNYNLIPTYAADHRQIPSRLMLTTESHPAKAFPLWQISNDNSFVLGDLTWTAMDYLGESGIGAWSYGTPKQAQMAKQMMDGMFTTSLVDKLFLGMANGVDVMAAMAQGPADPDMKAVMGVMFHGYPWHAAVCGDLDLTGFRKPQSYYRDILWNGGDRVYATVRFPEPEGKKIIAVGWATYPTLPTWSWPGQDGKELQVDVYSGAEKVRLFLNDKLIGEKATGREQEFKATFSVPFVPGTLKAVGLRGDHPVAESVLTTAGNPVHLRLTPDRAEVRADGQDLSFVTVEAVDSEGRFQPHADQDIQFSISGPGVIAAVGNGDGQDDGSNQGDHRKLFQGRALVVVRTSRQAGLLLIKASSPALSDGLAKINATAQDESDQLR
jgi:beta-galactosidase